MENFDVSFSPNRSTEAPGEEVEMKWTFPGREYKPDFVSLLTKDYF